MQARARLNNTRSTARKLGAQHTPNIRPLSSATRPRMRSTLDGIAQPLTHSMCNAIRRRMHNTPNGTRRTRNTRSATPRRMHNMLPAIRVLRPTLNTALLARSMPDTP